MGKSLKILCTCPPMIRQIDQMKPWFEDLNWEVTCPEFEQTLSEETLIGLVPAYDGWIIGDDPATSRVFAAGRKGALRAAVKWGAGVDNVDFAGARAAEIPVTNTPGTFGEEVSDVAIGYLIGLARGLFQIDRGVRNHRWPKPAGKSLTGCHVGVVGLGHIGQCLSRKLQALGLRVVGYDPYVTAENTAAFTYASWPEQLDQLDFLILTCNLSADNFHLVNRTTLSALKTGAMLINVSRGGLVDEEALAQALDSGKIRAAALEVMEVEPLPQDSPLRRFDQVVFGSHNSSNTVEAVVRTSRIAMDKLNAFLGEVT